MNALQKAIQSLNNCLKPPPDISVSEWADRFRVLSREASAEAGVWRTSRAPYFREPMDACRDPLVQKIVVKSASQMGKALSLDTPIYTANGWSTMGEIKKGDRVFDEKGNQCNVTFVSDVMMNREVYNVKFSDGSVIKADRDHLWNVNVRKKRGAVETLSTGEMVDLGVKSGTANNFSIDNTKPLKIKEKELPIDPYVLGVWLGDGHSRCGLITSHIDDSEHYKIYFESKGHHVEIRNDDKRAPNTCTIHIDGRLNDNKKKFCIRGHDKEKLGLTSKGHCAECARQHAMRYKHNDYSYLDEKLSHTTFTAQLRNCNLLRNKHIPEDYLNASINQRLLLLQGLMDTDGTITKKGHCEFSNNSKKICEGVFWLLVSLGYKPTIKIKKVKGFEGYEHYRVSFTAYKEIPVFRLNRKIDRMKSISDPKTRTTETFKRRIVSIDRIESEPVKCIQVDSESRLYLAGKSLIPTHNTELLLNIIGYFSHNDPSPMLLIQPTVEMAEAFSKDRLAPMIRDTKVLSEVFGNAKSRSSNNTILHKNFSGGHLTLIGSNSPSNLAMRPIRIMLADEICRYPASAGTEGNPVDLAEARTTTFHNRLILLVSTPTEAHTCQITAQYEQSSKGKYSMLCPSCDHLNVIARDSLVIEDDPLTVRAACSECGSIHTEREWKKREGIYVHDEPDNPIKGFWLNAYASNFITWVEIERKYLAAKGNNEKLKVFTNTVLAEVWDDAGESADPVALLNRRENYEEVPQDCLILTMAVDVQDNRLEYEVCGWGEGLESWSIEYGVFIGDPSKPEVWQQLRDKFNKQKYTHQSGLEMSIIAMVIDSGGHHTQDVYDFTESMKPERAWPIRGVGGWGRPLIKEGVTKSKRTGKKVKIWNIAVDSAKIWLDNRLKQQEPGEGYCHFNFKFNNELYFEGLTSEKLVNSRDKNGYPTKKWVLEAGKRNEPLDLRVYNYACVKMLNPVFEKLKEVYKPGSESAAQPKRRRKQRGVISKGIS